MRVLNIACLFLGCLVSAQAADKADLDKRLFNLRTKFEALQAKPDKRIPAEVLRRAAGIVLLDRVKAGFGFAYQGGGGVAMVKDTKSGAWGAPLFLSASQASFGPQAGGRESFTVLLLMSTNSTLSLTQPNFQFGGGASVTAGNSGGGVDGTIASPDARVLVYGDSEGFYGGASVKTGRFTPDADDNLAYYGQNLMPSRILFEHEGRPTEAARDLAQELTRFSK